MKTRTAQLTAIAGIAIAAALLVSPYVIAATTTTTNTSTNSSTSSSTTNKSNTCPQGPAMGRGLGGAMTGGPDQFYSQSTATLTVGQTITATSTQGEYHVIGTPSSNGTASGTITFTVTGQLSEGYTLSITGGSLVVNGTTYTMSSGTAQAGRGADVITGQGTTSSTGQFLLQGFARGSFAGTRGQLLLDFKAGSTEYAVALAGTIQS